MAEWLTFQELCNKKKLIEPYELIPYLKRGLQPYDSIGGEAILCPSEDHEYYISNPRLMDINTTLHAIRVLRNVHRQLHKVSEVKKGDFMGHLMFIIVELNRNGHHFNYPFDPDEKDIKFSKENTAWMTDEFGKELSKLLDSLSQESKEIRKRQKEIKLLDPSLTSWEYFHEPNIDGYSFAKSIADENCKLPQNIWPKEKLEKLYEILRNAYYRKKDADLAFGPFGIIEKRRAIIYAKESWKENKELTITDLAREINRKFKVPRAEKTIRRWIDKYAPDHSRGRRKGKQKKLPGKL